MTKKQAAATTPKISGANRGNQAMGKIARNVSRRLEVVDAREDARLDHEEHAVGHGDHRGEREHRQAEQPFDQEDQVDRDDPRAPDVGELPLDEPDRPAPAAQGPEERGPGAQARR